MAPVTGPYVGSANPVRGISGGGLPWMIKSASGSLTRNGQLRVRVRGLVLARQAPVPPAMQGVNPIADFEAVVSCQSIGAGTTAAVTNVITGQFPASTAGNSRDPGPGSPAPAVHRPGRVRDVARRPRRLVRCDRRLAASSIRHAGPGAAA